MVQKVGRGLLALQGHGEGRQRQFGAEIIAHRPANRLAAEQIQDHRHVQPAFVGRHIDDVGEPESVQRGGGKVTVQEIGAIGRA